MSKRRALVTVIEPTNKSTGKDKSNSSVDVRDLQDLVSKDDFKKNVSTLLAIFGTMTLVGITYLIIKKHQ